MLSIRIISLDEIKKKSFEEIFEDRISKYYNVPINKLFKDFNVPKSKQMDHSLFKRIIKSILGLDDNEESIELVKADIAMKTVRINSKGINPQHMSFPAYRFTDMVKEEEWEDSKFYNFVSKKFMFVLIMEDESDGWMINKVKFYNLSLDELNECKKVWIDMKTVLKSGKIIKKIRKNGIRRITFLNQKTTPYHM